MSTFSEDSREAAGEMKSALAPLFRIGSLILVLFFGLAMFLGVLSYAASWFGEAGTVVREEVGPRALLKKYEWFKDASAKLSALDADIKLYDSRISEFKDLKRKDMDRQDKSELSQLKAERIGVAATYNNLSADYNSSMAKINYRFCNVGDLPAGAERVLPKGYPEYRTR